MISFAQTHKRSNPQWHVVRLQTQQLVAREHERVKMRFNRIYMAARTPRGMSLWMAPDNDGADLYLSPQGLPLTDDLIHRYQARPCAPPAKAAVLIAGDGYTRHEPIGRTLPTRQMRPSTGRFLPLPYTYRCVRSLAPGKRAKPVAGSQMAPFVRRYALAWDLSPPAP